MGRLLRTRRYDARRNSDVWTEEENNKRGSGLYGVGYLLMVRHFVMLYDPPHSRACKGLRGGLAYSRGQFPTDGSPSFCPMFARPRDAETRTGAEGRFCR